MSDSQTSSTEQRQHSRRRTWKSAQVLLHDNAAVANCTVRDISANGARLAFKSFAPLPKRFRLRINEMGTFECEIVRVSDLDYGVRFLDIVVPASLATNPVTTMLASMRT